MANRNDSFKKRNEDSKKDIEFAKEYFTSNDIYVTDFAWIDQQILTKSEIREVPAEIMKMPDLMIIKDNNPMLIEVKSGARNHVMLKLNDLNGYQYWNKYLWKVYLMFGNKPYIISLDAIRNLYKKHRYEIKETTNDYIPKKYFELPYKDLDEEV